MLTTSSSVVTTKTNEATRTSNHNVKKLFATFAEINSLSLNWSNTEITKALSSLPTHERDAVRLVVCEGLSYEEASASLGVPVSTVNNWKYRGINKLKEHASEMESRYSA